MMAAQATAGFDGLRFDHWQVEHRVDGVVVVTIDRAGQSVNALSQDMLIELGALVERLANRRISDGLARLARRGSTKVPNYVLPSVRAARDAGRGYDLLALAVAGWFRFLRGYDYAGVEVPVEDPRSELTELARRAGVDPRPLLARTESLYAACLI